MVRKLIILGIDGMDWDVIVRYKDKLPNLYGLMQKNNYPHLRSVFPADTTPAWSTIYTGHDPSEHPPAHGDPASPRGQRGGDHREPAAAFLPLWKLG